MRYQLNCIARAADVAWQTLPLEEYQNPLYALTFLTRRVFLR